MKHKRSRATSPLPRELFLSLTHPQSFLPASQLSHLSPLFLLPFCPLLPLLPGRPLGFPDPLPLFYKAGWLSQALPTHPYFTSTNCGTHQCLYMQNIHVTMPRSRYGKWPTARRLPAHPSTHCRVSLLIELARF